MSLLWVKLKICKGSRLKTVDLIALPKLVNQKYHVMLSKRIINFIHQIPL